MGVTVHQCVLVIVVVLGCRQPPRDTSFDDPARASERVRAAVGSCAGLTKILDQLAAARVSGRLLIGLVDEAIASATCNDPRGAIKGNAAAHQLARARIDDANADAALAHLTAASEPAIHYRRAELLDRIGRAADADRELGDIALDEGALALQRLVRVSIAARGGAAAVAAKAIEEAPLPEQERLAHRAAEDAPADELAELAQTGSLELALAAADRLEQLRGPAAVLPAREHVAKLAPDVAEHWDALGRARIAAGQIDEALAAWDRATEIAPAQPAFRTTPIQALVIANQHQLARTRATKLATQARTAGDIELLVAASAGAAIAEDRKLAVELAREAFAKRSGDGRLAFALAQRLAEAGDLKQAIATYTDLLVCGAHGRAWHRHEVAGRLQKLGEQGDDARALVRGALTAKRTCETVEPDDLKQYIDGLSR